MVREKARPLSAASVARGDSGYNYTIAGDNGRRAAALEEDSVERMRDGREGRAAAAPPAGAAPRDGAEPVVLAEDIGYARGAYRSYEHLSLCVERGRLHALVDAGDGGARDALLSCAGLARPTAGSLTVCGVDAVRHGPRLRPLVGLGLFAGVNDFEPGQTAGEALAHELSLHRAPADEDAVLAGLADWLLATMVDAPVGSLAAADRARLGIACAAAGSPAVMVIPDIETGAAPAEAARTAALLSGYARRAGAAVLLATSSPAIARMADAWTPAGMAAAELMAAADKEAAHA